MPIISGLSGNEVYCLSQKGYLPGDISVGNSVYSLGFLGSFTSGLKSMIGGEVEQFTSLIEEGREQAFERMFAEAKQKNAQAITSVTSELIFHDGNIEFLSMGSLLHTPDTSQFNFSSACDGQGLYTLFDAGFQPLCFAFGNVAYAMGIARGIMGSLKTMARGEVKEFSQIFQHTRNLALDRISKHAVKHKANAVLGIKTSIFPFSSAKEMLMIGTGAYHPLLNNIIKDDIVTCDLTCPELWNLIKLGYAPMRLLLGTSVYSLGIIGNITSIFKSFARGEINELTKLIYDAREHALGIINDEAKAIGADIVLGVKTYVYNLGGGLIEFFAIGTALRKLDGMKTESDQLISQAVIQDHDTFFDLADFQVGANLSAPE